jgi:Family of unknown function (DUF6504)
MRRYDDPVEVRKGVADGWEGPEQFLWRGKLWKVRSVLAHWIETGSWWQSGEARAVIGTDDTGEIGDTGDTGDTAPSPVVPGEPVSRPGDRSGDLLEEREFWRVEAGDSRGGGVFDLSFDWSDGSWQLVGCVD